MIDAAQLLEEARSSSGLDDFGAPGALTAFARLVEDVNGSAHLSSTGEEVSRRQLKRILVSRLEVTQQLKVRPEVQDRSVAAPIVIAGFPRTGTTFLHRLMARDRQFDFLPYWQARRPYPPGVDGNDDPEVLRRRQEATDTLAATAALCPELPQIHPMGPDEPEECIVAMQLSFVSLQFELLYRVPGYSAGMSPEARLAAYRELATLLRLLQRVDGGGRWLLKSPGHTMEGWPLVEVFPDAHLVQVHRDPVTVMASFCSLAHAVRRIYSDDVDRGDLGREWLGRWADASALFADVRASMPEDRICDLRYTDLVRDPIATVGTIYQHFGLALTPETVSAMQTMVDDCRATPLRHTYSLADYEVTEKEVTDALAPYLDRFAPLVG